MTWSIQINGHDDLQQEAKEAFENGLIGMARQLVEDIKSGDGITINLASATTNTTGQVDLLGGEEEASAEDTQPAEGETA